MSPVLELTAFRALPAWELPAAHYLLMIQAGAWAMLAGCLPKALALRHSPALRAWAVFAATGLALTAPLNLVAEMLSPGRFPTMLFKPHPSSPLSFGVAAILALCAAGLWQCWTITKGDRAGGLLSARLACLAALGTVAYTWIEVDRASGVPLWSGPWPSAALAASGLAAGMAVSLGLVSLFGTRVGAGAGRAPRLVACLACAASGLALFGWGAFEPWPALPGWPMSTVLLAGGGFAFLAAAWLFPSASGARLGWASLLALAGAWAARAGILAAGQAASLGRNLGEPDLAGHLGMLTSVAPMALWVFFMFAASIALSRMPGLAAQEGGRP